MSRKVAIIYETIRCPLLKQGVKVQQYQASARHFVPIIAEYFKHQTESSSLSNVNIFFICVHVNWLTTDQLRPISSTNYKKKLFINQAFFFGTQPNSLSLWNISAIDQLNAKMFTNLTETIKISVFADLCDVN